MSNPILSILVITHNQRDLLKRCLISVLNQKLNVPFEVIISDDRSNDGTEQMIQDLKNNYEGKVENLVELKYVKCNSDDCNPLSLSERCGWNKLNAWRYARGKYMVNVDADDFLCNDTIYQKQIDLLEQNPQCALCQQQLVLIEDGQSISEGEITPQGKSLVTGRILKFNNLFRHELLFINQSYMIVRHDGDDMVELYGKLYDDTIITLHHLRYGNVVFLEDAGYVWVKYPKSISNLLSKEEQVVLYNLLTLQHIQYVPQLAGNLLYCGLGGLNYLLKVGIDYKLSEEQKKYVSQFDGFLFRFYSSDRRSFFDRCLFRLDKILVFLLNKYRIGSPYSLRWCYRLLTSKTSSYKIPNKSWILTNDVLANEQ